MSSFGKKLTKFVANKIYLYLFSTDLGIKYRELFRVKRNTTRSYAAIANATRLCVSLHSDYSKYSQHKTQSTLGRRSFINIARQGSGGNWAAAWAEGS